MLDVIIEIDFPLDPEPDLQNLNLSPRVRCRNIIDALFHDAQLCILIIIFLYFYVAAYQQLHREMEYL